MKKQLCLILFVTASTLGQSIPPRPSPGGIPTGTINIAYSGAADAPALTKFNLDFPGGNPKQLVAAIEKATSRPLNVVIPDEYANESISALRMTQVTVPDLFQAMEAASLKSEQYRTGSFYGGGVGRPSFSYQTMNTTISFRTSGPLSDGSIWYFRGREKAPDISAWDEKPAPTKVSRFYALTPYLEQGLKVEDITTAIQTGWKMLGEKETPSISFHKETKLLIAVGDPAKLETIDAVLKALNQKYVIDPATGLPTPQSGSFSDRMNTLTRRSTLPAPALGRTNLATPKPPVAPESEP